MCACVCDTHNKHYIVIIIIYRQMLEVCIRIHYKKLGDYHMWYVNGYFCPLIIIMYSLSVCLYIYYIVCFIIRESSTLHLVKHFFI